MIKNEASLSLSVDQMQNLFGGNDVFLKKIEKEYSVDIFDRNGVLHIKGDQTDKALLVIKRLMGIVDNRGTVEEQNVNYAISLTDNTDNKSENILVDLDSDVICHTVNGRPVKPKTIGLC